MKEGARVPNQPSRNDALEFLAGQPISTSSINSEKRTVDIVFFTGIDVPRDAAKSPAARTSSCRLLIERARLPRRARESGAGMYNLIQVRYRNNVKGLVDDITLEELIQSKRISHFYRPTEDRWVDTSIDPVRTAGEVNLAGRYRRASDWEEQEDEEEEVAGEGQERGFLTIEQIQGMVAPIETAYEQGQLE